MHVEGRLARESAVYSDKLCQTILKGIKQQMQVDGLLQRGCYELQAHDDEKDRSEAVNRPREGFSGKYRDDLTGQILNDKLVEAARAKEIAYFVAKGVWKMVPRATSYQRTGRPPITVRWVDVNNGGRHHPQLPLEVGGQAVESHR